MCKIGLILPTGQASLFATGSLEFSLKEKFGESALEKLDVPVLRDLVSLRSYDILVLPPSHGHRSPYRDFMTEDICENIKKYAEKGAIAAFCSGAYALTERFSYRFPNGKIQNHSGYIPLIDGKAEGPEDRDFKDRTGGSRFDDTRILPVSSHVSGQPELLNLCYANGPAFDPDVLRDRDDVRILATFEKSGNVSILAKKMPEGGVVMAFGSLPEIQASHIPSDYPDTATAMRKTMEEAEAGRSKLWNTAMAILKSKELYPA